MPIWVSVGGFAAHEYAETCAQLDDVTIELNLTCPNVDEAPESAAEIVAACREATANPLYAKLSPHSWDMGETVRAVEAAGADGVSLVNTLRGVALDARLRPTLARVRRRLLGTGVETGRACRGARRATRDRVADRRHGRRAERTRRARADRVRCDARRTRHGAVRRPGRAGARSRRACRRSDARRVRAVRSDAFGVALDGVARLAN